MKRILVVDDEKENVDLLTQYLAGEGYAIQGASESETALHRVKAWKPHLILLDINMPGISGLELIQKIRDATPQDYVAIILVSGNLTADDVTRGLEAGADDYVTKPFRVQELMSRVRTMLKLKETHDSLRRANQRIEELVSQDEMTGLYNMRTLIRRCDEEILRSSRLRKPLSVMLVNLDGFSDYNQRFGFNAGNAILQHTAQIIRSCLRSIDLAGRVGGDEFFVVLVETDLSGAEFMAERLRDAIKSKPFPADKSQLTLTAGIGVAGLSHEVGETRGVDLFKIAQEALKSAKFAGPNSVEIHSFV